MCARLLGLNTSATPPYARCNSVTIVTRESLQVLAMTTEVERRSCESQDGDAYAEFEYQLMVEALARELEIVKVKEIYLFKGTVSDLLSLIACTRHCVAH